MKAWTTSAGKAVRHACHASFVEFGPGGSDRVEIGPGDFVLIPMGVVHREGNADEEPNDGVIVRVGDGPVTVNLDGPESG